MIICDKINNSNTCKDCSHSKPHNVIMNNLSKDCCGDTIQNYCYKNGKLIEVICREV